MYSMVAFSAISRSASVDSGSPPFLLSQYNMDSLSIRKQLRWRYDTLFPRLYSAWTVLKAVNA
jgi:hypothetical protein